MSRVRVECFSVSVDGYGAGPAQSVEHPLGVGGERLHQWIFPPGAASAVSTGVDGGFIARGFEHVGAWILGRNMFGPVRGAWPDESWRGWWGERPPYHVPVFVLTHHARPPIEMDGGTTFHFVTEGIHEALTRARSVAGDKDVRIGGGARTIRQYLEAGLIDEMHLAIAPTMLGSGERLFEGLDLPTLGYEVKGQEAGEAATHVRIARR